LYSIFQLLHRIWIFATIFENSFKKDEIIIVLIKIFKKFIPRMFLSLFFLSENVMDENVSDEKEEISEIKKLDAALDLMLSAKSNMNAMFKGMDSILKTAKKTLMALENEKNELEKQQEISQQEISGLNEEQTKLLDEYATLKEELEKISKIATTDGDVKISDMKATLSILNTLVTEIWQSQPHFKVLLLLHGDKEVMNINDLKNASGIGGAMILRACHELANANLIIFDIDERKAKLVQRLYPKKAKENKK
jgi:hypothetical protein